MSGCEDLGGDLGVSVPHMFEAYGAGARTAEPTR